MKSKSKKLKFLIDNLDSTLSKVHQKTIDGRPINPGDDEWNASRDRLIQTKVMMGNFNVFPINWQLADYLIGDELANREKAHPEHIQYMKERN